MTHVPVGLCWGTVHQAGLVEMIDLAGRFGFATIEVPPHIYFAAREAGHDDADLRSRLADAGVRVSLIDCISSGFPGAAPQTLEFAGWHIPPYDVDQCRRVAEALDAPVINLSFFGTEPVPLPAMADGIGELCRRAGPSQQVVLEFYPGSAVGTLVEAHQVVTACVEPNCAILLDTWHFARSGGAIEQIDALPPGAIGALQVSDPQRTSARHRLCADDRKKTPRGRRTATSRDPQRGACKQPGARAGNRSIQRRSRANDGGGCGGKDSGGREEVASPLTRAPAGAKVSAAAQSYRLMNCVPARARHRIVAAAAMPSGPAHAQGSGQERHVSSIGEAAELQEQRQSGELQA